ncbi:ATP-binding protein [Nocardia lijiangensis]|uniref:ATP-binding protein n=1 Tax=Nocardia lijiangensis TaxID=299618 RepID=UPI00082E23C2|nr:ATP-binding protein [Nocardia lijiangensis]
MSGEDSRFHRVTIGGSVAGQVVVGENNVVINAQGSQVFVRDGPPPEVRRRTRPVGVPIPRARGDMIGRLAELRFVAESLDQGVPVEISGPPGVGKTTVLRRFAADRARGGHPVVYLSAAGLAVEDLIQSLFQACYDAVDYRPDPAVLRRLMGSIRALVVIDDFGGSAADLDSVLDIVPAGDLVVATMARVLWGQGRSLELQGLPEPQAMALLAGVAGRGLGHSDAARRLCRAARGHPLALVRAAAWVAQSGTGELFTDPGLLQRAMIAGLAGHVRDALGVLCALAGMPVKPALLGILLRRPDAAAALAALERVHLAEPTAAGYRLTGNPTALTADWQGALPDPADFVAPLRDWAVRTATAPEILELDVVVVRVLRAGMVRGRHDSVRELARAVSPVLGRALRWGCWKEVLAVGLQAATQVGHAADLAYFTRESHVREQALGMAVGMTVGVGAGATVVAAQQAGSHTVQSALRSVAFGHPVATGTVVAALAAAVTVTGVRLTSGDAPPAAGQAPITTVLSTATTGLLPVTRTPEQTSGPAQAPPPPRAPATPRTDPGPGATDCAPQTYLVTFEAVVGGEPVTRPGEFPWLSCDNEAAAALSGDPAFEAAPNPCPPVGVSGCVYDFTFSPTEPGDYAAKLVIPSDSGGSAITFELRGSAVLPPTGTTSPTGSPSTTTTPPSTTTTTTTTTPPSPTVSLPASSSTLEPPLIPIPTT